MMPIVAQAQITRQWLQFLLATETTRSKRRRHILDNAEESFIPAARMLEVLSLPYLDNRCHLDRGCVRVAYLSFLRIYFYVSTKLV